MRNLETPWPNFIGVGMERCGTSWVYKVLASHPDIWVPPVKELHYFDAIDPSITRDDPRYKRHIKARLKHKLAAIRNIQERPELYKNTLLESLSWDLAYFTGKKHDDWYGRLFDEKYTKGRVSGEITPAYANLSADLIDQKFRNKKNLKVILMTRLPESRLRSGLIHHFKNEMGRDLYAVNEDEMIAYLKRQDVQEKSNSGEIVKKWAAALHKDQLFIGDLEDIKSSPEAFVSRLFQFLGVDEKMIISTRLLNEKVNNYSHKDDIIPENVEKEIFLITQKMQIS